MKHLFEFDGALRDIYVSGASLEDWDAVLAALRSSRFPCTYQCDGEDAPVPRSVKELFDEVERRNRLLAIDVDGNRIHCFFFYPEEIEFDFEPLSVTDQRTLESLLEFLPLVVDATGKTAIVTPESMQSSAFIRLVPNASPEYIPMEQWWVP